MTNQSSNKRAVGQFATKPEAEEAQTALQAAGFAPEQISIETETLDPTPSQINSQARESSVGAAIAGSVLGSGVALFASLGAVNLGSSSPDVSSHSGVFTVLIAMAGGLVGALGFGLIGALSGGTAPKAPAQSDSKSLSTKYLVVVRGNATALEKAKEILSEQGAQV